MSKYSQKIDSWMKKNSEIIDSFNQSLVIPLENESILRTIYESLFNAANKKHNIKLVDQSQIKAMHGKKDFPLMYIFFYNLQYTGLLDNIIKFVPDFLDYDVFDAWYHENIDIIDNKQIDTLMNMLDVKNVAYQQLIDVYRIMHKMSGSRKLLHDVLYKNNFIGIDIQHEIESHEINFKKYIIDDVHVINLFLLQKENSFNPNLELIAIIIDAMDQLSKKYNTNTPVPVDLTILCTNKKKSIISNNKSLGPNNINSGSTLPGRNIVCWRQEELYKVLIHELIHFHNFDFHDTDPNYEPLESMINLPKIIGSDKLNESYTETVAIIIMCILVMEQKNPTFQYDLFTDLLKKEILFSMFQVAKVLNKLGASSLTDYFNNKITIEQTTSFRSYFIIKLLLLLNLSKTIQFMNHGLVVHGPRILDFGQLINDSYEKFKENSKVIDTIDNMITLIKNHEAEDEWIYWTLRMSANDIE